MAIKAEPPYFPADEAAAVTPSDIVNIPGVPDSGAKLYVGGAGNVSVQMARSGASILFTAVPAGTFLPIRVVRVNAAATTATAIVALW